MFTFVMLRSIGNFLLLFAIFGVIATFGPAFYYEAQFRIAQFRGVRYAVAEQSKEQTPLRPGSVGSSKTPLGELIAKQQATPPPSGLASVLTGPKEQILVPPNPNFSIVIPKIGANSLVIPNVNANNEKEFLKDLQQGVAHAKGTVFPGQKGNIYLFAHSADNFWDAGRYNAVFYLLKDLTVGDTITVFFENIRHNYKVVETKIVDPSEVSYLIKSQEGGEETLILQTCWPPGTTWKRLLVIARPSK